jgi:nucleotide-binding universal stress UspA family protein
MDTPNDNKVMACVDPSDYARVVTDYGAWAAARMRAPLELLHVIDVHESPVASTDRSGALGLDTQEALLKQLSEEDRAKAIEARQAGRLFLSALRQRALGHGLTEVDIRQRQGGLHETLSEQAAHVRLIVLGRRGQSAALTQKALGRHVEHIVRAVHKPILAVTDAFSAPERVVFAFDGSSVTRKGIHTIAASPLLTGLPIHLQMSGAPSKERRNQLAAAQRKLQDAGFEVSTDLQQGDPVTVIAKAVEDQKANLLIMGAYTQSPWRSLFFGSNTNALLQASRVTALLLR